MQYVINSDKNLSIIILYHNFLHLKYALTMTRLLIFSIDFSLFHISSLITHILTIYFGNLEIIRFNFAGARA